MSAIGRPPSRTAATGRTIRRLRSAWMGPPQAEAPLSGERPERRLEVIDGATRSAARRSAIAARRASYLAFVGADELGRRQHVPLDRLLQLGLSRAGSELEIAVRRVEAKDVTRRPVPPRGARPSVADRSEVVEHASRRIRVVDQQCQRSRFFGNVCPAKRWRDIVTVTGVPARDRARVLEDAALEGQRGHQQVRWSGAARLQSPTRTPKGAGPAPPL